MTEAESSTTDHMKGLVPLIDADVLLYRCGFAADAQVKTDIREQSGGISDEELQEILNETDYLNFALGNVKTVMEDFMYRFGVKDDSYKAFLTGSGNFREQVATILPYKGNRDESHKPKYYGDIKRYLFDIWGAERVDGREADDALGCAQWADKSRGTCIVTIDKDLDMVPGYHYNWVKKEFYDQSLEEANRFIFYQMLTGDRTDNIPGIRGIGSKTVSKLLDGCDLDSCRTVVRDKYKEQYEGEWERAYQEVGNLLWIQRIEGKECPYL
jgi:5''-3'' exonuclease (including N-terminal domain of PolI)